MVDIKVVKVQAILYPESSGFLDKKPEDSGYEIEVQGGKLLPIHSLKCHCLRKCSRGQKLWSTD